MRSRAKKSSIVIAIVSLVTVLAMLAPAAAAPGFVVALPGAASAGYATRPAVLQHWNNLKFVNLDIAPHDVRSTSGLFQSPIIGIGKQTIVFGANLLPRGTYAFYCTIHPNMRGNLRVI